MNGKKELPSKFIKSFMKSTIISRYQLKISIVYIFEESSLSSYEITQELNYCITWEYVTDNLKQMPIVHKLCLLTELCVLYLNFVSYTFGRSELYDFDTWISILLKYY